MSTIFVLLPTVLVNISSLAVNYSQDHIKHLSPNAITKFKASKTIQGFRGAQEKAFFASYVKFRTIIDGLFAFVLRAKIDFWIQ